MCIRDSDLIEDYSHIRSLGEALSGSKVHTYGLANCKFNPVSLATFVESVRWAEAAIARLNLSGNLPCDRISRDNDGQAPWLPGKDFSAWIPLCESFEQSKTLTEIDVSNCYLGPDALPPLAKATKVMAALTKIDVRNNNTLHADSLKTLKVAASQGCEILCD